MEKHVGLDDFESDIKGRISESMSVKERMMKDETLIHNIKRITVKLIELYERGGRLLIAGNGGSAADAQHIAAELVARFYLERRALAAMALNVDTSIITAIGNDYSFDRIYSRQVEANGKKGDLFLGISTSGNSKNIIEAINTAKQMGIETIGFTGENGGKMGDMCEVCLKIPSKDTPRIQESHIMIAHIICELVERHIAAIKK